MSVDILEDLVFVRGKAKNGVTKVVAVARWSSSNLFNHNIDGRLVRARSYELLIRTAVQSTEELLEEIIKYYLDAIHTIHANDRDGHSLEHILKNFSWFTGLYIGTYGQSGLKSWSQFERYLRNRAKYPVDLDELYQAFNINSNPDEDFQIILDYIENPSDEEVTRKYLTVMQIFYNLSRYYPATSRTKFRNVFTLVKKKIYGIRRKNRTNDKVWGIVDAEGVYVSRVRVGRKTASYWPVSYPYPAYVSKRNAEKVAKRLKRAFPNGTFTVKFIGANN